MRVSTATVKIEDFKAFAIEIGAVPLEPSAAAGEIFRFQLGPAIGSVAQRKNQSMTFVGVARHVVQQFFARKKLDDEAWISRHRSAISEHVLRVRDRRTLEGIAALTGFEPKGKAA